jgi:hypothetical protein
MIKLKVEKEIAEPKLEQKIIEKSENLMTKVDQKAIQDFLQET